MRTTAYLESNLRYQFFIGFLMLLVGVGNISGAIAEEKPAANEQQSTNLQDEQNKKSDQKSISDEDVKLWLKQIEIYGQIAKPQTVFIIPGTDPRVDGLKIDRHFFAHIFRPVEKSALRRVQVKQEKDKDHILW